MRRDFCTEASHLRFLLAYLSAAGLNAEAMRSRMKRLQQDWAKSHFRILAGT